MCGPTVPEGSLGPSARSTNFWQAKSDRHIGLVNLLVGAWSWSHLWVDVEVKFEPYHQPSIGHGKAVDNGAVRPVDARVRHHEEL